MAHPEENRKPRGCKNPRTCGIFGLDDLCASCRAYWDRVAGEKGPPPTTWQRLCDNNPVLAEACGYPLHQPVAPEPFSREHVAKLVATALHPDYRPLVEALAGELLSERVGAAIAAALAENRGGTYDHNTPSESGRG